MTADYQQFLEARIKLSGMHCFGCEMAIDALQYQLAFRQQHCPDSACGLL